MQFSPSSCHFLSLRSRYSPQHPVLKHHPVHLICHSTTSVIALSALPQKHYWIRWPETERPLNHKRVRQGQVLMIRAEYESVTPGFKKS
jgi:hypothetical protein